MICYLHVQRRIIFFRQRGAACQSTASETTRTRRKKTTGGYKERTRKGAASERRRRRHKASYRGGAGPDGIALPVSCLSRHVLASPTRNRPDYLDDSFLVLVPIHTRWLLASVALAATGSPGSPANVVTFDVLLPFSLSLLTSSPRLPSLLLLLCSRLTANREKSPKNSARSSCATRYTIERSRGSVVYQPRWFSMSLHLPHPRRNSYLISRLHRWSALINSPLSLLPISKLDRATTHLIRKVLFRN